MYWIEDIQKALNYIEENILADISVGDVSRSVHSSPDYFQKIFSIVTGFSVSEYIRNRRLSLAGQELACGKAKVIDVALKYHYETPESFAKAFSRFHGFPPSSIKMSRERFKTFTPITIQINVKGGFNMSVKLDVRSVGFLNNLKNDMRAPESFAFPACLTSLMECIGEDAKWETIHAHGREFTKRHLYNDILAATGMAFGLLWHRETCPSSFDLTQVNDHNTTIALGFDYIGYGCEIMERDDNNFDEMKRFITESIEEGVPVLAFGLVGPPECSIICGYDSGGDTLFGWSHFQSYDPADCENNGMFHISDWHKNVWKIVLCKGKREPQNDLKDIVRRGIAITQSDELLGELGNPLSGYLSGHAAYDAWINYITSPSYETMCDEELNRKYWFHNALVGNHAEARAYLGGYLHMQAGEGEELHKIADLYMEIHNICWQVWTAGGGFENPKAYKSIRERPKREEIASLIKKIEELDFSAVERLRAWLDK